MFIHFDGLIAHNGCGHEAHQNTNYLGILAYPPPMGVDRKSTNF